MNAEGIVCPLKYTLSLVGGKWKLPIVCMLAQGSPMRYSGIRRKLEGVTNTMLAQSLKELESAGLILRVQYNEVPPRVEYSITEEGERIMPILTDLSQWGREHMEQHDAAGDCCCRCAEHA